MRKTAQAILDNLDTILYNWNIEQISGILYLFTKDNKDFTGAKIYIANINGNYLTFEYKEAREHIVEFKVYDKNIVNKFVEFQDRFESAKDEARLNKFLSHLKG